MTKNERIERLERLLAELSKRVYDMEREQHQYVPRFVSPWIRTPGYVYYGATGGTINLGAPVSDTTIITSQSSSLGSVPQNETETPSAS